MTSPEHEIKDFGMDVFSTLGRGVDYNDGDIAIISTLLNPAVLGVILQNRALRSCCHKGISLRV